MKPHERIPQHDHSDRNSGGPLDRPSVTAAAGLSSSGGSGGGGSGITIIVASGFLDPRDYGALADARCVFDAAVSGGALSTVTSADADFTSADSGKLFTLLSTSGAKTVGTLTFVNDSTCTMSAAAGGAITAGRLIWGTDDFDAWQAAGNDGVPGQTVDIDASVYHSLIDCRGRQLNMPIGVQLGRSHSLPRTLDSNVVADDWGPTLVVVQDADHSVLLQQGAPLGNQIWFAANQVPPTADTPFAYGAMVGIDADTLPWGSRQTRVTGCEIDSPVMVNPYIGLYLRGGNHDIGSPRIGGLSASIVMDHMWDFTNIERLYAGRLACIENAGLGAAGLNVWYQSSGQPQVLRAYRADGFKIGELSSYAIYGGVEMNDSPDGAQDPNGYSCGYGVIGILDVDSCVQGVYARATNSPGLQIGTAIIGPNVSGYGDAGAVAVWTDAGGSLAPLVSISQWAVRGSWSVGVSLEDPGTTLLAPRTNPGQGDAYRDEPHVDYTGSVVVDGNGDPVMVLVR